MPAYWLARATITDPVAYKKYTDRVPEIIGRYQGKILARGGRYQIMEGPENFQRFVVIEFPTLEQARRLLRIARISGSRRLPPRRRRHRRERHRRRLEADGRAEVLKY